MLLTNSGKFILPILRDLSQTFLQPSTVGAAINIRSYALRKGTRERKLKLYLAAKKKAALRPPYVPKALRKKKAEEPTRKFDDSHLPIAEDNVFLQRHFRSIIYPFVEAVKCHREVQHPDMYNNPTANLQVTIELNMRAEKKTRTIDGFTRVVAIPHKFNHGQERTILAFVKDEKIHAEVLKAGAEVAGGVNLIKDIQNGVLSLDNFTHVIAHPAILPELVSLRGLMKRKFPSPKVGTLDFDLVGVVDRFLNGITYTAVKDESEKDFGIIETVIGTIDMDPQHLEENLVALLKDVMLNKPKREGHFISRCLLLSSPSDEQLKVDHLLYVTDETKQVDPIDEEPDPEEQVIAVE